MVGLAAGGVLLVQSHVGAPGSATLRSSAGASAPTAGPGLDGRPAGIASGSPAPVPRPAAGYRDGRYSADGTYLTPGGDESIGVTVVVAQGLVTEATVRVDALSPTARQFQIQFGTGVAAAVVGRDLADLSVTRVAGASLTSVGFDDALTRIRFDAEV